MWRDTDHADKALQNDWLQCLSKRNIIFDNFSVLSLVTRSTSHVKGDRRGGVCVLWLLLFLLFYFFFSFLKAQLNTWVSLPNGPQSSVTVTQLQLQSGLKYSVRISAMNGAGAISTYDTNGVLVDNTPPEVSIISIRYMALFYPARQLVSPLWMLPEQYLRMILTGFWSIIHHRRLALSLLIDFSIWSWLCSTQVGSSYFRGMNGVGGISTYDTDIWKRL